MLELRQSVLHFSSSNGEQRLQDSITLANQNTAVHNHMVQLTVGSAGLDLRMDPSTCTSNNGSCLSVSLKFVNATTWYLNGTAHFGGVANFTAYLRSLVQDVGGFTGCLGVGVCFYTICLYFNSTGHLLSVCLCILCESYV